MCFFAINTFLLRLDLFYTTNRQWIEINLLTYHPCLPCHISSKKIFHFFFFCFHQMFFYRYTHILTLISLQLNWSIDNQVNKSVIRLHGAIFHLEFYIFVCNIIHFMHLFQFNEHNHLYSYILYKVYIHFMYIFNILQLQRYWPHYLN